MQTPYAGEAGILLHMFGKFMILELKLDQGNENIRLIRSLRKFIFRYQDIVEIYSVSVDTIINDAFT
jgi:hypothetical protein